MQINHPLKFKVSAMNCFAVSGFLRSSHLQQHMLRNHPVGHRCNMCRKFFASEGQLKLHKETHDAEKEQAFCPKCGRGFWDPRQLRKHLKNKIDCMEKANIVNGLYVCKFCLEEFRTVEERTTHMYEAHKDQPRPKAQCQICGKILHRQSALNIHMKIHLQVG